MNGFNFNEIPRTVKYSFLLWMVIGVYYLIDLYIIFPMTGQIYNFISPFIIFGVIVVALGLLIYPTFILIRKSFNSLDSKFDIIMKLPKIFIFILKNIKLFIFSGTTFLLSIIRETDNQDDNIIYTNDIDIDPGTPDIGKPTGVTNTDWFLRKTDQYEEFDKNNNAYNNPD